MIIKSLDFSTETRRSKRFIMNARVKRVKKLKIKKIRFTRRFNDIRASDSSGKYV